MVDLILAEHNLTNQSGHYFEYDTAVKRAAERAGCCCRILGHQTVEEGIRTELDVVPHFRWRFAGRYPRWFRYLKRLAGLGQGVWFYQVQAGFGRDLRELSAAVDWDRRTLLLFPTLMAAEALAVVRWIESLPAARRPCVGLLLRFPVYQEYLGTRWSKRIHRTLFSALSRLAEPHRIQWFSDSSRLVEQYRQCGAGRVTILPIPHTLAPQSAGPRPSRSEGVRMDVRFLGRAVPEKGYGLLPDIFHPFVDDIARGSLRLTVQAGNEPTGHAEVDRTTRQLRQMGARLLGGVLESERYREALAAADVILLPYLRRENQYAGTSGIFADALALGRPVIVTDNTWMADQLETVGAGWAVSSGDIAGFQHALRRCLHELPELQSKAAKEAPRWRDRHNPDRFIKIMLESFQNQRDSE